MHLLPPRIGDAFPWIAAVLTLPLHPSLDVQARFSRLQFVLHGDHPNRLRAQCRDLIQCIAAFRGRNQYLCLVFDLLGAGVELISHGNGVYRTPLRDSIRGLVDLGKTTPSSRVSVTTSSAGPISGCAATMSRTKLADNLLVINLEQVRGKIPRCLAAGDFAEPRRVAADRFPRRFNIPKRTVGIDRLFDCRFTRRAVDRRFRALPPRPSWPLSPARPTPQVRSPRRNSS